MKILENKTIKKSGGLCPPYYFFYYISNMKTYKIRLEYSFDKKAREKEIWIVEDMNVFSIEQIEVKKDNKMISYYFLKDNGYLFERFKKSKNDTDEITGLEVKSTLYLVKNEIPKLMVAEKNYENEVIIQLLQNLGLNKIIRNFKIKNL